MDDDPRWSLLAPGELVHVDAMLRVTRNLLLPDAPKYPIGRADLSPAVELAQHSRGRA
jgi:glutamine amidotransferase